jgi:hypothetical protein
MALTDPVNHDRGISVVSNIGDADHDTSSTG